jgi:mono/diheme cytochrome c family protein
VTEIPEHLLKRSRERRSAMGDAPEGGDTPSQAVEPAAAATPAATASAPATPAAPKAPVVVPDPPYVRAAKERAKIPFWAMGTLSLLPIFIFMYWRGLTTEEQAIEGPIGAGAAIYTGAGACSGCHGADGGGGVGRQLSEGEIMKTFPYINDQLNFIYVGTQGFEAEGLPFYGNPDREGGPHLRYNGAAMPAQRGALSDLEILEVGCYIRYELGGADPAGEYAEEYEKWCSPEAEVFEGFEDGSLTFESEELAIGTVARPMQAPAE